MNTADKPALIELLLKSGYEFVICFDPDIELYAETSKSIDLALRYEAIPTPHAPEPLTDDGHWPCNLCWNFRAKEESVRHGIARIRHSGRAGAPICTGCEEH